MGNAPRMPGGSSGLKTLYSYFTSDKFGVFFVSKTAGDSIALSSVGINYTKSNSEPAVFLPIMLDSINGVWAVLGLSESAISGTTGSRIYEHQVSYKGKTIYIKYASVTGAQGTKTLAFNLNGISRNVQINASYKNDTGDIVNFWDKPEANEVYDMVLAILGAAK